MDKNNIRAPLPKIKVMGRKEDSSRHHSHKREKHKRDRDRSRSKERKESKRLREQEREAEKKRKEEEKRKLEIEEQMIQEENKRVEEMIGDKGADDLLIDKVEEARKMEEELEKTRKEIAMLIEQENEELEASKKDIPI